jgi:putative tricarboxylic transport membrane protein
MIFSENRFPLFGIMLTCGGSRVDTDQQTANAVTERDAWARPVSTRRGELIAAAALFLSGIFFVWQSAGMPFGHVGLPGPGFFPFVLGIALCFLALVIGVQVWREHPAGEHIDLGHRDVVTVFAALLGLALGFERLGAYLALGLFTAVCLVLVARMSLLRAGISAALGMVAVWVAFNLVLGVVLPRGPF